MRWPGILGLAAFAVLAAGCAAPDYPVETPTAPPAQAPPMATPSAPEPAPVTPPRAPPLRSPIPGSRAQARDTCGAAQMQGMIGHPRTLIPVPVDPGRQRVACTTCPKAEDVDPARLNFLFNARTGLIEQVRCG